MLKKRIIFVNGSAVWNEMKIVRKGKTLTSSATANVWHRHGSSIKRYNKLSSISFISFTTHHKQTCYECKNAESERWHTKLFHVVRKSFQPLLKIGFYAQIQPKFAKNETANQKSRLAQGITFPFTISPVPDRYHGDNLFATAQSRTALVIGTDDQLPCHVSGSNCRIPRLFRVVRWWDEMPDQNSRLAWAWA